MIAYLGLNVALAVVMVCMLGVRSRIAYRAQLRIARALVSVTSAAAMTAVAVVLCNGLSWSVGLETLSTSSRADSGLPSVTLVAVIALLVVAACKLIRLALTYRELKATLRGASVLRRHGRVTIVATDRIDVPCSVRMLRRRWVVLPDYLLANRADLRFAVSHELQHHRNDDTSWAWLAQSLAIALWANPVVHLWHRWHAAMQELACDEALRAKPGFDVASYAQCLLSVAERAVSERHAFALAPSMARRTQLHARIEKLFEPAGRSASRPVVTAALAVAVILGVSISGFAAGWTSQPSALAVADDSLTAVPTNVFDDEPCEDSDTAMECR